MTLVQGARVVVRSGKLGLLGTVRSTGVCGAVIDLDHGPGQWVAYEEILPVHASWTERALATARDAQAQAQTLANISGEAKERFTWRREAKRLDTVIARIVRRDIRRHTTR